MSRRSSIIVSLISAPSVAAFPVTFRIIGRDGSWNEAASNDLPNGASASFIRGFGGAFRSYAELRTGKNALCRLLLEVGIFGVIIFQL